MNLDIKAATETLQLEVDKYYTNHGSCHDGDAGLDLFLLQDYIVPPKAVSFKIPLGICTEAYYTVDRKWRDTISGQSGGTTIRNSTSYYIYPRSSLGSRTPIRLANSIGVIDRGYRGELIAIVDNVSNQPFAMKAGERYFQICGPNLESIKITIVKELSESSRGIGGFGSTGN